MRIRGYGRTTRTLFNLMAGVVMLASAETALAQPADQAPSRAAPLSISETKPFRRQPTKELMIMAEETRSSTGAAEMKAAKALTTKVLAIGSWTAKATPETRPAIMPFEARDTLRLELAGKIDQWFAKSDGSGAVFLMNVTDPAEAHSLLDGLPLGKAQMMTFELIPMGALATRPAAARTGEIAARSTSPRFVHASAMRRALFRTARITTS